MAIQNTEKIEVLKNKRLVAIIDGDWNDYHFISFFETIKLVNRYTIAKERNDEIELTTLKGQRVVRLVNFPLKVKSIKYGSLGGIEYILSASSIVAILALIRYYIPNSKDRAQKELFNAETALTYARESKENQDTKQQGIKNEIEILKSLGFEEKEILERYTPMLDEMFDRLNEFKHMKKVGRIISLEEKDLEEDEPNNTKY